MAGTPWVVPSRDDPDIATAAGAIGGPAGAYSRIGGHWWHPLRVAALVALTTYIVAILLKAPCITSGFTGIERYTRMCYSDIPPLYQGRGFADGLRPYLDSAPGIAPFEYPVLTGALAQFEAWLAALSGNAGAGSFFAAHVLLTGVLFLVVVIATGLTARPRYWDAVLVAVSPALLVTATINWDMLAVALVALWLLLWSRRAVFWSGVVLGLAVAAKFYPLLLLGPMLILAIRHKQLGAFFRMAGAALGSWLIVNVPVAVANPEGWARFYSFSSERGADWGSIWLVASIGGVPVPHLNTIGIVALALLCAAIAALIWWSPTPPRVAPMLFLTLAAFLATNKVYSPQFVMWLVPLAVLALPRLRPLMVWQLAELLYFAAVWWYFVELEQPGGGLHEGWYAAAIVIRVAVLGWFASLLVQLTLTPERDPVRKYAEDPAGGVFADNRALPSHLS